MLKFSIYLDNSATTPLDSRVVEKMLPYLTDHIGNPASLNHAFGRAARRSVDDARVEAARLFDSDPAENHCEDLS